MPKANCPVCGAPFKKNYEGRRTCSDACASARKGSFEGRYWARVKKSVGCWEWQGRVEKTGYARVRRENSRERVPTHRLSWELTHGFIPEGMFVLHHCDNRKCVRPDHLFLGTQLDNMHDMREKGRQVQVRGAQHGRAKLTEEQVLQLLVDYRSGVFTQKQLADKYGLHYVYVNKIIKGHKWAHLPR